MDPLRQYRCCFTGHRPQKLNYPEPEIKRILREAVGRALDDGYRTFITGMAQGIDLWGAEIVLELCAKDANIHLICASPFPGFEERWSDAWRRRYQNVLQQGDLVRYIQPAYSPECFALRNRWMVDHASRLIAVWNGSPGGTAYTLRYAQQQNLDIVRIDLPTTNSTPPQKHSP